MSQARSLFEAKARPQLRTLAALVTGGDTGQDSASSDQYYRFHGMFQYSLQRLAFSAALAHYLATEKLVTHGEVASDEWLGLAPTRQQGFHLDLEVNV